MANIFDIDTWHEVGSALMRNKTRSFLTGFGIFWGVLMLILLWSGGTGVITFMGGLFEGIATNITLVDAERTTENYAGFKKGRSWEITTTDALAIRANVEGLRTVVPFLAQWNQRVVAGSHSTTAVIKGADNDLYNVLAIKVLDGRSITPADNAANAKVVALGEKIATELFPDGDCVGKQVNVAGGSYTVVGVIQPYSTNVQIGPSDEDAVHMPMHVMQTAFNMHNTIGGLVIEMEQGTKLDDVLPDIRRILYKSHKISPTDERALSAFDLASMFKMVESLVLGLRLLALLVGAGTLLAGLIGVSNIMTVILKERTSEIGIRRAIGAKPSEILWQFLAESTVLTLSAGLTGLIVAVGITAGLEKALDFPLVISFSESLGITLLFVVLGIAAGILPARNAMKIKPIEAMHDK